MARHLLITFPVLAICSIILFSGTVAGVSPHRRLDETYDTFLKNACQVTSYPTECYSSLSGYGSVVKTSKPLLAIVAISVSLNNTSGVHGFFSNLLKDTSGVDHGALSVCVELLKDGIDEMKDSMQKLQNIGTNSIDDVYNSMNTAVTGLGTCIHVFEEDDEPGQVKGVVDAKIGDLTKATSIAFSLVKWLGGSI